MLEELLTWGRVAQSAGRADAGQRVLSIDFFHGTLETDDGIEL